MLVFIPFVRSLAVQVFVNLSILDDLRLLQAGRIQECSQSLALVYTRKAVAILPTPSVSALRRLGRSLFFCGELNAAGVVFRQTDRYDALSALDLLRLAQIADREHDYGRVVTILKRIPVNNWSTSASWIRALYLRNLLKSVETVSVTTGLGRGTLLAEIFKVDPANLYAVAKSCTAPATCPAHTGRPCSTSRK